MRTKERSPHVGVACANLFARVYRRPHCTGKQVCPWHLGSTRARNETASKPRRAHRAMTLIEVVGGLALLGTLLVAVLLAKAKFTRQAATADRKLQAVAAADELLTVWRQDSNALPRDGVGPVPGDRQFSWRT